MSNKVRAKERFISYLRAIADYEESLLAVQKYLEEWPDACQTCGASGKVCWEDDPSVDDISLSRGFIMFVEPCSECHENSRCPRCGDEGTVIEHPTQDGHFMCTQCYWDDIHAYKWQPPVYEMPMEDHDFVSFHIRVGIAERKIGEAVVRDLGGYEVDINTEE